MEFTQVKNVRWGDSEHSFIECDVMFTELGQLVPFTAHPDDIEKHGRDIFEKCAAGEYGHIGDYESLSDE